MERIHAYRLDKHPSYRLKFLERLSGEGFEIMQTWENESQVRSKRKDGRVSVPLGNIDHAHLEIYSEENMTTPYDISERTRLARLCDEFKMG